MSRENRAWSCNRDPEPGVTDTLRLIYEFYMLVFMKCIENVNRKSMTWTLSTSQHPAGGNLSWWACFRLRHQRVNAEPKPSKQPALIYVTFHRRNQELHDKVRYIRDTAANVEKIKAAASFNVLHNHQLVYWSFSEFGQVKHVCSSLRDIFWWCSLGLCSSSSFCPGDRACLK